MEEAQVTCARMVVQMSAEISRKPDATDAQKGGNDAQVFRASDTHQPTFNQDFGQAVRSFADTPVSHVESTLFGKDNPLNHQLNIHDKAGTPSIDQIGGHGHGTNRETGVAPQHKDETAPVRSAQDVRQHKDETGARTAAPSDQQHKDEKSRVAAPQGEHQHKDETAPVRSAQDVRQQKDETGARTAASSDQQHKDEKPRVAAPQGDQQHKDETGASVAGQNDQQHKDEKLHVPAAQGDQHHKDEKLQVPGAQGDQQHKDEKLHVPGAQGDQQHKDEKLHVPGAQGDQQHKDEKLQVPGAQGDQQHKDEKSHVPAAQGDQAHKDEKVQVPAAQGDQQHKDEKLHVPGAQGDQQHKDEKLHVPGAQGDQQHKDETGARVAGQNDQQHKDEKSHVPAAQGDQAHKDEPAPVRPAQSEQQHKTEGKADTQTDVARPAQPTQSVPSGEHHDPKTPAAPVESSKKVEGKQADAKEVEPKQVELKPVVPQHLDTQHVDRQDVERKQVEAKAPVASSASAETVNKSQEVKPAPAQDHPIKTESKVTAASGSESPVEKAKAPVVAHNDQTSAPVNPKEPAKVDYPPKEPAKAVEHPVAPASADVAGHIQDQIRKAADATKDSVTKVADAVKDGHNNDQVRGQQGNPVPPNHTEAKQADPIQPVRTEGKQTDPIHPVRTEGKQTDPIQPARTESKQSEPIQPVRTEGKTEPVRNELKQNETLHAEPSKQIEPVRGEGRQTEPVRADGRQIEVSHVDQGKQHVDQVRIDGKDNLPVRTEIAAKEAAIHGGAEGLQRVAETTHSANPVSSNEVHLKGSVSVNAAEGTTRAAGLEAGKGEIAASAGGTAHLKGELGGASAGVPSGKEGKDGKDEKFYEPRRLVGAPQETVAESKIAPVMDHNHNRRFGSSSDSALAKESANGLRDASAVSAIGGKEAAAREIAGIPTREGARETAGRDAVSINKEVAQSVKDIAAAISRETMLVRDFSNIRAERLAGVEGVRAERTVNGAADKTVERGVTAGQERPTERAAINGQERTAERTLTAAQDRTGERVIGSAQERSAERAIAAAQDKATERNADRTERFVNDSKDAITLATRVAQAVEASSNRTPSNEIGSRTLIGDKKSEVTISAPTETTTKSTQNSGSQPGVSLTVEIGTRTSKTEKSAEQKTETTVTASGQYTNLITAGLSNDPNSTVQNGPNGQQSTGTADPYGQNGGVALNPVNLPGVQITGQDPQAAAQGSTQDPAQSGQLPAGAGHVHLTPTGVSVETPTGAWINIQGGQLVETPVGTYIISPQGVWVENSNGNYVQLPTGQTSPSNPISEAPVGSSYQPTILSNPIGFIVEEVASVILNSFQPDQSYTPSYSTDYSVGQSSDSYVPSFTTPDVVAPYATTVEPTYVVQDTYQPATNDYSTTDTYTSPTNYVAPIVASVDDQQYVDQIADSLQNFISTANGDYSIDTSAMNAPQDFQPSNVPGDWFGTVTQEDPIMMPTQDPTVSYQANDPIIYQSNDPLSNVSNDPILQSADPYYTQKDPQSPVSFNQDPQDPNYWMQDPVPADYTSQDPISAPSNDPLAAQPEANTAGTHPLVGGVELDQPIDQQVAQPQFENSDNGQSTATADYANNDGSNNNSNRASDDVINPTTGRDLYVAQDDDRIENSYIAATISGGEQATWQVGNVETPIDVDAQWFAQELKRREEEERRQKEESERRQREDEARRRDEEARRQWDEQQRKIRDSILAAQKKEQQEQQLLVLDRRARYIVKSGDTLQSIAQTMLRDAHLALLVYNINKSIIPVNVVDGKQVPQLKKGMVIELPTMKEVVAFRANISKVTRNAVRSTSNEPTNDARRKSIQSLLGKFEMISEENLTYRVRLGDTLRSIAVKHPALQDVSLWPLLAEVNELTKRIDSKGTPLARLDRGMTLVIPTADQIADFKTKVAV